MIQKMVQFFSERQYEPKKNEILKVLLAKECNNECPYTGKTITLDNLLGSSPQFDIEHTLPFSRSLDNSYANKTLCYHEENRNFKRNKTPYETYGHDSQRWNDIIERVKRFQGSSAEIKLRRFQMKEIPEGFTNRHLSDTRYISRLAGDYLALLYGGRYDAEGTQRIQVSTGAMTAYLRDEWKLNAILNDGGDAKNRSDHRHHAVDAAVIAMNDQGTIKKLSNAAKIASEQGWRLFMKGGIEEPITDFLAKVKVAVDKINISFRANRKVSGGFHDETNYSKPQIVVEGEGKKVKQVEYRHVRKPIAGMSKNEVNDIVDPIVRDLVLEKLKALGTDDPRKLTENDLPYLRSKDGKRLIPIRKARIRKSVGTMTVGKDGRERHVAPGNNHHMEVVAVLDKDGKETKWEGIVVTMFEAYQRKRQGKPIINRDHGPWKLFKFSLALNEYFMMKDQNGVEQLYVVRVITQDQKGAKSVASKLHNDARPSTEILKTKGLIHNANTFMEKGIRKVTVDVLGNIHPAND